MIRFNTLFKTFVIIVLFGVVCSVNAYANGSLEIHVYKYDIGTAENRYMIRFDASKVGASDCQLTTPDGTFILISDGDEFEPPEDFYETYRNLTIAELSGALNANWTLTFDDGLATQTVATIFYGSIDESDFLPMPTITNPLDGAENVSPNTSIEWSYTVPTADAQVDIVYLEVLFTDDYLSPDFPGSDDIWYSSGSLPLSTISWTPSSSLDVGTWTAVLKNGKNTRLVSDGIGGSITGDSWVLDNGSWFAVYSLYTAVFEVSEDDPEPNPGDDGDDGWCFINTI